MKDWTDYADCRSVGPAPFYPEKGDTWSVGIDVCRICPVRLRCLDFAMRLELGRPTKHRFGIFGGLKPSQRRRYEAEWLATQEAA